MIYNLSKQSDVDLFDMQVEYIKAAKKNVELKTKQKTRTITQNSALHLWFKFISDELNEAGAAFTYENLNGHHFEIPYTEILVKATIIKPIMMAMFEKESTTELTTAEINKMIDVINKFFGDKGVYLPFPSIQTMLNHYNK